ncbi:unnamed protein product, partial [Rotaria magnacalcarata]
ISASPPSSSSILKSVCSPLTGSLANNRQRINSASVIQQSDVSSSRPALLADDALGPLLFEVGQKNFLLYSFHFERQCNKV